MVLNNYYSWRSTVDRVEGNGYITVVNDAGNQVTIFSNYNYNWQRYNMSLVPNNGDDKILFVTIGTGTATPTLDNYCLTDILSTTSNSSGASITNYSYSIQTSSTADDARTTIVISGVNNTGSTITISELGLYKKMWYQEDVDRYYNVYFIRETLNNPIEVPPHRGFFIAFEWVQP